MLPQIQRFKKVQIEMIKSYPGHSESHFEISDASTNRGIVVMENGMQLPASEV